LCLSIGTLLFTFFVFSFTTEEIGENLLAGFSHKIPTKDCKVLMKMKKKFMKTCEMVERFCFVVSVTCFSRPNIGRDDGDDDEFIFMK
jgi:hypothetical protein